ncbi:MAG: ATP-binding protein [Bacteroidales bacterium]
MKTKKGDHRSLNYTEEAIKLADSLDIDERIAESNYISGLAWKLCGDNSTAILKLYTAAKTYSEIKQTNKYAETLREIGETYRANGNHAISLDYLKKALKIQQEQLDSQEMAKTYNRIAATNYEVIFYKDTYLKITTSNNPSVEAMKNLLQSDKDLKKKIDSTFLFLDISDEFARKYNQTETIVSNKIIRGALYSAIFDFEQADSTLNIAMQLVEQENQFKEKPLVYYNLARLRMYQKRYTEAIDFSVRAFNQAKDDETRIYKLINANLLGDLYQKVSKPSEAIKYMNIAQNEVSFFYKNDLGVRINALQYQSELDKKKAEILLQSTKTKYLTIFFIYIVSIFILFALIIYLKNKKLRKLNRQLENKSRIIAEQNAELIAHNTERDKFYSIIAHDLRGPAGTFVSVTDIMVHELRKKKIDKALLLSDNLQIVAHHLYSLLENLLDWSKIQRGAIIYSPITIKLKRIIEDTSLAIIDSAKNKGVTINFDISDDLEIITDAHMLQTIIRNILSNAIKFTLKGGSVKILAKEKTEIIEIKIADTGIGMDQEIIDNLFLANNSSNRLGTDYEPSSGLGLVLCKDFVDKMGGIISVKSEVSVGSEFIIKLPKQKSDAL